jgi:hypothetical protein
MDKKSTDTEDFLVRLEKDEIEALLSDSDAMLEEHTTAWDLRQRAESKLREAISPSLRDS